jgi:hypothetical protein
MPYRILILEPVRDEAACQRETYVRGAPSLQPHEFEHIYAAEYVALDETQPIQTRLVRSQEKSLDENMLLHRLNERVAEFRADILLVNSGALFGRYPEEVLYVLRMIKALHPRLRIGFHPRAFERSRPKAYFEYTNEMGRLMADVFAEALK